MLIVGSDGPTRNNAPRSDWFEVPELGPRRSGSRRASVQKTADAAGATTAAASVAAAAAARLAVNIPQRRASARWGQNAAGVSLTAAARPVSEPGGSQAARHRPGGAARSTRHSVTTTALTWPKRKPSETGRVCTRAAATRPRATGPHGPQRVNSGRNAIPVATHSSTSWTADHTQPAATKGIRASGIAPIAEKGG